MTREEDMPSLTNLPLEVRHSIFEHLSARKTKPRKLMRHWFEKEEVESLVKDYVLHNASEPAPTVLCDDDDDDCDTECESVIDENRKEDMDNKNGKEDGRQEEQGDEDENQVADEDSKSETTGNDGNAEQLPPPRSIVQPSKKWRHIPHFLRLTLCPPPTELFLASRKLNIEAKNWYYDMTILRINATGSFVHTNFFVQAMTVLSETNASSPLDNIRKAEVTFVWDSTWIRKDVTGTSQRVLPDVLRKRARFVCRALERATELRELVIRWHDSAQDSEAARLKNEVLGPFNALSTTIKIQEHYIAPDFEPEKRSIAGKRRLEFENIYYWGLDHA